jgi:Tfp pilus assembly protein PilF
MDFERRATKAYERGDAVRAVVSLAEGLKRRPDCRDAAEALVEYYVEGLDSPGLERDVVSGLVETPDAQTHLQAIYSQLIVAGRGKMARAFERAAADEGFDLVRQSARDSRGSQNREVETPSQQGDGEDGAAPEENGAGKVAGAPGGSESSAASEARAGAAGRESDGESSDVSTKVRSVEARGPRGPVEQEPGEESRVDYRRVLSGVAAVLALVGLGYIAWQQWQPLQAGRVLDRQLRELDPNASTRLEETEAWERSSGLSEERRRERRQFAEATRALERGDTYEVDETPGTAWGWSAAAMAALSDDLVERAVRIATRLRRTQPKGNLPRIWTNARVAEFRGRAGRAARLYRDGQARFPEFVPLLTGALRIAFVQMDRRAVDKLVGRLEGASSGHPYAVLAEIPFPTAEAIAEPTERQTSADPGSAFLELVHDYETALGRLTAGDYESAIGRASRLLARQMHFGPALWVRAVAATAVFDVEAADADFERLVELPGLSVPYRRRLRAVAPKVLTHAGRPDLGARYVTPKGGSIRQRPRSRVGDEEGDSEPVNTTIVLRTSHWELDAQTGGGTVDQSEGRAVVERRIRLARLRVLLELGHVDRARRLLQQLSERGDAGSSRRVDMLRAEVDVRRGRRPAGTAEWARESASPEDRMVQAYYEGDFEKAIEVGDALLEEASSLQVMRYVASSYAATDRGRRALQVIDGYEGSPLEAPAVQRLRTRIVSRLWTRSAPSGRARERLLELEPTATRAIVDLAATMLWRHQTERASELSSEGLERSPDYPEVNWVRGVLLRLKGEDDAAERFVERSWRAGGAGERLSMELGYVNLALGHPERARDLFYTALMASPGSVEAIRGLGRSYDRFSDREGMWNFERIYENYQQDSSRRLQAAEVQRWLGVFDGVRGGEPDGKVHIERAVEKVGRRATLMLELARYHLAREEFGEAKGLLLDALQKDSTLADAHLGLAKVADADNNTEAVRTHLRQYLELDSGGPHAEWARERLDAVTPSGEESSAGD